jgi:hypothetical protein
LVFFTVNLYNFILFILNNFLKKIKKPHRWIYRRNEFVGILQKVEKYLLKIPQSPMLSQTDNVCWHFTESWKIFTRKCHYHRRNIFVDICLARIFFWRAFSVCKTIGNIFFPDRRSDGMWDYQRNICRQTLFVGDLVGKKFTDEVWISYRWILSVGKTMKSYSV